jgi:intraflagellar transport protein 140
MLALQSPSELQLEAAQYLEEHGILDKAIILYQKGGNLGKALDLCFQVITNIETSAL